MEGTLSPTFDETLEFRGIFGEMATSGVAFELFDKDLLKADDLLGEVHVSLEALQSAATHEYSKPLSTVGTISFTLTWVKADGAPSGNVFAPRPSNQPGTLKVHLRGAQGLARKDYRAAPPAPPPV